MRQAYDYWQNQPGNYRAPGLASTALVTGRRTSHWEGPPGSAGAFQGVPPAGRHRRLAPVGTLQGHPLSPSLFPRGLSAGTRRLKSGPGAAYAPQEETSSPEVQLFSVPKGRVSPVAHLECWPEASRPQNPSGVDRARGHDRHRATRLSATPWRAPLQGVTAVMGRLDRGVSPTRLHNGPRDDDLFG